MIEEIRLLWDYYCHKSMATIFDVTYTLFLQNAKKMDCVLKMIHFWGAWVAQSVKRPTSLRS